MLHIYKAIAITNQAWPKAARSSREVLELDHASVNLWCWRKFKMELGAEIWGPNPMTEWLTSWTYPRIRVKRWVRSQGPTPLLHSFCRKKHCDRPYCSTQYIDPQSAFNLSFVISWIIFFIFFLFSLLPSVRVFLHII